MEETMGESIRTTRMALVEETVEGTLVYPSSGANFIPIETGFSMDYERESIENEELSGSLGKKKTVPGLPTAKASFSLYPKGSGVEGQAPSSGVNVLLKALWGAQSTASVEYDTIAGSTVTAINVGVGEGATFSIGEGLLVKHSAFAWELAVIKGITGDVLTPLFALNNAPATGTNLGKAIHYTTAESGHKTLSVHGYWGNGQAYVAEPGCRPISMVASGDAAGFLNAQFELEGLDQFYDPILIAATDIKLDFTDDDGTTVATIVAGTYRSPKALADTLTAACQAVTTQTMVIEWIESSGKFKIYSTGTLLSLLWNTGANAANTVGDKLGFLVAADDTGTGAVTGYTADTEKDWSAPYTPAFDDNDPIILRNSKLMVGTQLQNECVGASNVSYELTMDKIDKLSLCSVNGKSGVALDTRSINLSCEVLVEEHKVRWYEALQDATGIGFQLNTGPKSGTNFLVGKSMILHAKDCTVTVHNLGEKDGLVNLALELVAFVDASQNSEGGQNFL